MVYYCEMIRGLLTIIAAAALYLEWFWLTSGIVGFMFGCTVTIISASWESSGKGLSDKDYELVIHRLFGRYW